MKDDESYEFKGGPIEQTCRIIGSGVGVLIGIPLVCATAAVEKAMGGDTASADSATQKVMENAVAIGEEVGGFVPRMVAGAIFGEIIGNDGGHDSDS